MSHQVSVQVRHLSSACARSTRKGLVPKTRAVHQQPPFNRKSRYELTEPPCPSWKLGQGALFKENTEGARRSWDMSPTSSKDAYRLLTTAVVPRPIALVSSISRDGIHNLAPFSYFSLVAHNPPMISISFSLSPRRPKCTRENILQTKEFTVNIITEDIVEAANATGVEAPGHVDEWVMSGLTMAPSISIKPPIARESPVNFECELYSSQDIPHPDTKEITTTVILGAVKHIHALESVLSAEADSVDIGKLRPVSRLGGIAYARVLDGFAIPRVSWKASKEQYELLHGK